MSQPRSVIWNYFETHTGDKIADCKLCDKQLSFKTSVTNLKQHLKLKHGLAYDEFLKLKLDLSMDKPGTYKRTPQKAKNLPIWNYFDPNVDKGHKFADCRLCKKTLSYKTTITNLKQHLKQKHVSSYNELLEQGNSMVVYPSEKLSTTSESDDAAEELLKVTDVWSYFDTDDSGKRAQCVPCKATVPNEYEELKAHLKDNHPKLLLQILQNKDQSSDAASNDGDTDNDNIFTEVVYLDPEPTDNITRKEKTKSLSKPIKKRERLHSLYSSDETPVKKPKQEEPEENDELSTFIKYITCLLKKLPPDAFSNVQIEIINAIQKANSQANNIRSIFNKEQEHTCSNIITVDGITPISSAMVGHNYTITVAPPKDVTENS